MHYYIFRSITRLQTVLLHSIHCKNQFRILQYITFVYTNYSRLLLYYTSLHLNDPLRRNLVGKKCHRTNRYDALRYISTYDTATNGSAAFVTLQAPIPHITVYYICIHKIITFVTLLHLITPQ